MRRILDRIALLLAGLVASAAAWAFWHYAGENAVYAFPGIVFLLLYADNKQMRRRLRRAGLSDTDLR